MFTCTECNKAFANIKSLQMHEMTHASSSRFAKEDISRDGNLVKRVKSAFKTRVVTLSFTNRNEGCLLPEVFLKLLS